MLAVMGGGKVSFEIPRGWVHKVKDYGLAFYDRQPPANDCIFEATLIINPPGPIRDFPVWKMLQETVSRDGHFIAEEDIVKQYRGDTEVAWLRYRQIHPSQDRIAVFNHSLIRGSGFHALFTYAYWPEEAERLAPVWTRALDSFEIGIPNPHPN